MSIARHVGEDESSTRARILDSARRLFLHQGYAATSLADIAADVGLTKTAVAYHFHPKERLLVELVSPALEEMSRELGPLPTTTREQRRAFIRRLVEVLVRHRDVVGILAEDSGLLALPTMAGSPPPRELLVARLLPARPTQRDVVRAWASIGCAQIAVARTVDLPAELVTEVALAAALAAFDS